MFVRIVVFSQSFDDVWFTYEIPEWMICTPGMIAKVPVWKKETYGLIMEIFETSNIPQEKIKQILWLYSWDVFLSSDHIQIIDWMAQHYFCLIHQCLPLFFPKNLREKIEKWTFHFWNKTTLEYTFENTSVLLPEQKKVFDVICESQDKKFLLQGVTGSGKTEIYIALIEYYKQKWKQVLLLVPEIILTNQIFQRIQKVFWDEVFVLHSWVSEAKKTSYWQSIAQNNAKIIVWTRSSLFYPYQDLGMIIIDEEHDNSYISDNAPRYDAVEVANKMSDLSETKLLLWSATPRVTHMYEALQWKYHMLQLFREFHL